MNKITFFLTWLIIFLMFFNTCLGYSSSNFKPKYGITTTRLNFRLKASISASTLVKTLDKSTSVKMVGSIDNFYIVQLSTNEVGLVSKDFVTSSSSPPLGAKVYENYSKYYTTVSKDAVALRGGPSTSFKVYKRLNKNEKVEVIGIIDNFYMVVTEDNYVGMIRNDLLDKLEVPVKNATVLTNTSNSKINTLLTLINTERKNAGVPALMLDSSLTKLAQIKSNDMVKNNYFAHNSPTYGSPFKMMQDDGISYKVAGENIAGNPSLDNAVASWMNSETHKKNLLSNTYNYVGLGISESKTYGYIIVAMFIGK